MSPQYALLPAFFPPPKKDHKCPSFLLQPFQRWGCHEEGARVTTPCRHGPQAAGSFVLLEEVVVAVMAQYLTRDISLAAKTSCAQRRPLTVHHRPGTLCCVCHLVAGHTSPTGPPYATSDSSPAEGGFGRTKSQTWNGRSWWDSSLSSSPWFSPEHCHQEKLPPNDSFRVTRALSVQMGFGHPGGQWHIVLIYFASRAVNGTR